MADWKRNPWCALIEKVAFRVAFAVCILIQVILLTLLVAGLAALSPSNNEFIQHFLVALVFFGLLPIGAGSYLLFQRLTRPDYVRAEAERWLTERQHPNPAG